MAREYNIKWSDKDERELQRVVRNFNAKVKRLEEKQPFLRDVRPDKISYKDIKENITTRRDLNRELNRIQRFSKKGSEDVRTTAGGVTTTEYQFKEAVILQRTVTAKRRKKRAGITSLQQLEAESLVDKPKVSEISESGFKRYYKSLLKEVRATYDTEKQELYLNNYIKALKDNLGIYSEQVINYIKNLPLDSFVSASMTNPLLVISFIYTESDREAVGQAIFEEWQRVT